jgi:hypothetical protein
MTNAQRYFENVVNVPHTVLGIKLQPLCILHFLWLQHLESPLIQTDKPATIEDLELAVIVCSSLSNEEILAKLSTPALLSLERLKRLMWHRSNRKADLKAELLKFIAYQDDYCSLPAFMGNDGNTIDEKLPWLLLYQAALIKSTGWSEQEVVTMPLGKVVWLNTAFGYLNSGECSVVSDKEAKAMELLRSLTSGA